MIVNVIISINANYMVEYDEHRKRDMYFNKFCEEFVTLIFFAYSSKLILTNAPFINMVHIFNKMSQLHIIKKGREILIYYRLI